MLPPCRFYRNFAHSGGAAATMAQAQEFIEAEIELLTDYFYDGLSPEQAAQKVLDE